MGKPTVRDLLMAIDAVLDGLPENTGEGRTQHYGTIRRSIPALERLRVIRERFGEG